MVKHGACSCFKEVFLLRIWESFSEDEVVDYPDIALKACLGIREGKYSRGILVRGAGIGMVIVAEVDVPLRE